ncbi:MAG: hypothetical protein OEW67_14325 [Cyclobacteriaceae bacterium]|nr:hypothetical protein [Cyclobacteriaceae bacterium]
MKLIKLTANIIGVFALLTGISSCKDDEVAANECCTLTETYTYNGVTETYTQKACQDGTWTYTYGDGTTGSYKWNDDPTYTWTEVKSYMVSAGATCS